MRTSAYQICIVPCGAEFADHEVSRICRQFLATFLPSLVDEVDYAAEFLLLYRHDEDVKPSAAAGNSNAGTASLHRLASHHTALCHPKLTWPVYLHRLGEPCALGPSALMAPPP